MSGDAAGARRPVPVRTPVRCGAMAFLQDAGQSAALTVRRAWGVVVLARLAADRRVRFEILF